MQAYYKMSIKLKKRGITSNPDALSKTSAGAISKDEVHRIVVRWIKEGPSIYSNNFIYLSGLLQN